MNSLDKDLCILYTQNRTDRGHAPDNNHEHNNEDAPYLLSKGYSDVLEEVPDEDRDIHRKEPAPAQGPEYSPKDGAWQAALVARSLSGDESAFTLIIEQYGGLLLRTAYLLIRDEEEAKDIVQEALILAWKNLEKLREPAFLRAWLLKIVVNQSLGLKRQLARKAALLREQLLQQQVNRTIQDADLQRGRIEETLDVAQAIGQLPLKQRVVLVLFYYHRMTMPEIASLLGVSENTLRKRLQAALEKVRRVLQVEVSNAQERGLTSTDIHSHINIRRGGGQ